MESSSANWATYLQICKELPEKLVCFLKQNGMPALGENLHAYKYYFAIDKKL